MNSPNCTGRPDPGRMREERGARRARTVLNGPDNIRRQFYQLYHWHTDLKLADVGNIRTGATLADTYAALKTVMSELIGHRENGDHPGWFT